MGWQWTRKYMSLSLIIYSIKWEGRSPENWETNNWDSFAWCIGSLIKEYLAWHSVTILEHPPFSFELAPVDFYSFLQLKNSLKGKVIRMPVTWWPNAMKMRMLSQNGFQACFQKLYRCWSKCVAAKEITLLKEVYSKIFLCKQFLKNKQILETF